MWDIRNYEKQIYEIAKANGQITMDE